jgi:hypothetical protein
MHWNDFRNFFQIIEKDNLSLFYRGDFADEITVRLIDISDLHFGNTSEVISMKKKVGFLMAECFQNVIRHGDVNPADEGLPEHSSYFVSRNINGNFFIASGNLIENQFVDNLRAKIDNINKLDKDKLKSLYMKVLGTDEISSKGGAGLGLIEMARKSGRELESSFTRINNKLSFFYIQILIPISRKTDPAPEPVSSPISHAIELNEILKRNNVLMAYQGDFRQKSILPLLNMIDKNLKIKKGENAINKHLFHVLVEMLQNIMHHGYATEDRREGIFSIGIAGQKYNICAANYILNEHVAELKNKLDRYLSMSMDGLKDEYKSILRGGPKNHDGGAGLGFIDIMRASEQQLNFEFVKLDDVKTLFYLNVLL